MSDGIIVALDTTIGDAGTELTNTDVEGQRLNRKALAAIEVNNSGVVTLKGKLRVGDNYVLIEAFPTSIMKQINLPHFYQFTRTTPGTGESKVIICQLRG